MAEKISIKTIYTIICGPCKAKSKLHLDAGDEIPDYIEGRGNVRDAGAAESKTLQCLACGGDWFTFMPPEISS